MRVESDSQGGDEDAEGGWAGNVQGYEGCQRDHLKQTHQVS